MTKKILSYGFLALVLIFLYAPILLLVVYSFTPSVIIGQWSGFSFKLYADLFMTERVRTMILNTVVLAVVAATLSTILGTIGAIGIYYSRGKIGKAVKGVSNLNVINAEIVIAVSLALLFSLLSFNKTYFPSSWDTWR